jgi:nicotinate dehydrogenase subunit A
MTAISLTVNGNPVDVTADPDTPCSTSCATISAWSAPNSAAGLEQCGCCMVLVDGSAGKSCGKAVSTVAGKAVSTIEGLGTRERRTRCSRPFSTNRPGMRLLPPGILISAKALLDRNPAPSRARSPRALDDNICRCGSHARIIRAVERAAPTCAQERHDERRRLAAAARANPRLDQWVGFPSRARAVSTGRVEIGQGRADRDAADRRRGAGCRPGRIGCRPATRR